MIWRIIVFFDELEDTIRIYLTRHPFFYSIVGVVGIVCVWKGVWETVDLFPFLYGPMSLIIGVVILLMSGLLVSLLIGDSIILLGGKGGKKILTETHIERKPKENVSESILEKLENIEKDIEEIKEHEHIA